MDRIRLLLVDDSAIFAQTAKQFLGEDTRLEVLAIASSGMEAVNRIDTERPHIVLMDLHMPFMNGLQATRRIKALGSPPKVVVISLDDSPENRRDALAAGADAFLGKAKVGSELFGLIDRLAPPPAPSPPAGRT